jgi:hypothetical protein
MACGKDAGAVEGGGRIRNWQTVKRADNSQIVNNIAFSFPPISLMTSKSKCLLVGDHKDLYL